MSRLVSAPRRTRRVRALRRRGVLVLLTGEPGVGKTWVCQTVVDMARHRGLRVAGLVSQSHELASGRVVQTVVNLRTGDRRRLADLVGAEDGDPIGGGVAGRFSWKFVGDSIRWGRHELDRCVGRDLDLLVIDQIGPLELVAGSGWVNALATVRDATAGLTLVVVNPLVLDALCRGLGVEGATVVEVDATTRALLPDHLLAAAGWHLVLGQELLSDRAPRLLAADLDGTLLGPGGVAPPGVVEALRQASAAGVRFAACTGRPTDYAFRAMRSLGVARGQVISYGGAALHELGSGEALGQVVLPPETRAAVLEVAGSFGLQATPLPATGETLRIVLTGDGADVELAADALAREQGDRIITLRPTADALAVQAAGATKDAALAKLAERTGVDPARTVYLGDAGDDAGPLRWAGLGIAVSEGSQEARVAADLEVTADLVPEMLVRVALASRLGD